MDVADSAACKPREGGITLAKTNFEFQKRQRELEKKRKKEEKKQRKQERTEEPAAGAPDDPAATAKATAQ